jgi:isopentenyl phosphate kinase
VTVDYLSLKIGGSLFSDKSSENSLDRSALDAYARLVAPLARRHPGRVVLITGGGAIGHGAVRRGTIGPGMTGPGMISHGAVRSQPARSVRSLVGLTEAISSVRWAWTEALVRAGVEAFPLQLAAMCTIAAGRPRVSAGAVRACLSAGALPVLSGDCLLTDQGQLCAFSSDRVPEVLMTAVDGGVRVVMMTDVPGIVVGGPHGTEVLRDLDPWHPERAYELVWQQSEWDSTGSMRAKLDALVSCARSGAECYIMRGDPQRADLEFLFADVAGWPAGQQYTRVAAGRSRT